jgi:hypothetical protein
MVPKVKEGTTADRNELVNAIDNRRSESRLNLCNKSTMR